MDKRVRRVDRGVDRVEVREVDRGVDRRIDGL